MELSQRQDLSFRGDHADILRQEFEKMERESYPPPSSPINMQGEAMALITLTQKLTLRATAL